LAQETVGRKPCLQVAPGAALCDVSARRFWGMIRMIAFDQVSFGYRGRTVIRDVSLTLESGGFYFLTGPSGSGKTTFLGLCSLALQPQSGRLVLFGKDAAEFSRASVAQARRRMGIIHQDCRFLDHLDLRRNVLLPIEVDGRKPADHLQDVDDLLGWVGLSERAHALPPELSGGERQRAALARAVMLSPDILIADEPTGNVDREMGQRVLLLLIELNRLGRTILVATHDLDLIRSAKGEVAARILRLSQGQIQQAGSGL